MGEWLELAGPWLDRASVIKASDEDLDWMGMTIDDLLVRGAAAVLRTAGPAGVDVHVKGHDPFTVASVRGEVADTVGAGDSFCGAVLAQLYRRKLATVEAIAAVGPDTWREIVSFGVKAASITVGRLGADPPWASEIDEPATA